MKMISDLDIYMFGKGTHYEIYNKLGAHIVQRNGVKGTFFAVWAPFAFSVSVVGDFNSWDISKNIMVYDEVSGIWTLFIPKVSEGYLYKYRITSTNGKITDKADPYAFHAEVRPNSASIIYDIEGYDWND